MRYGTRALVRHFFLGLGEVPMTHGTSSQTQRGGAQYWPQQGDCATSGDVACGKRITAHAVDHEFRHAAAALADDSRTAVRGASLTTRPHGSLKLGSTMQVAP